MKKNDFMRSEVFKILRNVTVNSMDVIFFKFIVSMGGGGPLWLLAPVAKNNLATPRVARF